MFLQTKRLKVHRPTREDLENYLKLFSDPEVMRYIGNGQTRNLENTKSYLDKAIHHWEKHGFGLGPIFEKETGEFVGDAGLVHLGLDDRNAEIELGYRLKKKFWGKGYATEIARAWIAWGFDHLPLKEIIASVYEENESSRHVLEKVGMSFYKVDIYPGTESQSLFFRILRESYPM